MKICLAQSKPFKSSTDLNIVEHEKMIRVAAANAADLIIFPELSLTGYETLIAKELSIDYADSRLDRFQHLADSLKIVIGISFPGVEGDSINITCAFFQPNKQRVFYSKRYLHEDELPFFKAGVTPCFLQIKDHNISVAICYEISIDKHSLEAFENGATLYLATVAKTKQGMEKAFETLQAIASKYSMFALVCNSVGYQDSFLAAGQSAVWNRKGERLAQLDSESVGLLIFDTSSETVQTSVTKSSTL